jgi:hypothetical protein
MHSSIHLHLWMFNMQAHYYTFFSMSLLHMGISNFHILPPRDLISILMTSLIGIINTMFLSLLRVYSHSHDIHMESIAEKFVTMFPFPYENNQQDNTLS